MSESLIVHLLGQHWRNLSHSPIAPHTLAEWHPTRLPLTLNFQIRKSDNVIPGRFQPDGAHSVVFGLAGAGLACRGNGNSPRLSPKLLALYHV